MMKSTSARRRAPRQLRAHHTVEAILDGAIRVLKREGLNALTTNRIAAIAGVSIGSVYQYFPDKRAIFLALHTRHVEQIDGIVEETLTSHASASLEKLMAALIDALIDAHLRDPELHLLLSIEVPDRADGTKDFSTRLHGAFLLAISARARELKRGRSPEKLAFVATHMLESLAHGVARGLPPGISREEASAEILRAVLAYLRS
jgi:AcrR family transcriptional regulator